ncbi:glutamate carboxypeptidase 2-like [Watersipora subatra]|uniref:glutamate carboxypeptidase 2-like n=1 Tax=Watersipora subatra TaxID=2589382 RepID=UPI00355C7F93
MEDTKSDTSGYSRWNSSTENIQLDIRRNKQSFYKTWSWKRWFIITIFSALTAMILGFIFGYLTKRAIHLKASTDGDATPAPTPAYNQKYNNEAYEKLSALIDTPSMVTYINDYATSGVTYHAGSTNVNNSLHEIDKHCKKSGLTLTGINFSKVLLSRPNSMTYKVEGANTFSDSTADATPDTLKPFVAYTHSGDAAGPPVYVDYGYNSNFSSTVDYNGAICYMRYGRLNPYNMIMNAVSHNCTGVVLYPDPEDFPDLKETDAIISNGKSIAGDPQTPGFPSVTVNTYKLRRDQITGRYIPPNIPIISASQAMVKPALSSLVTQNSTQIIKTGPLLNGYLNRDPASDTNVTISVNNEFPSEKITSNMCASRGGLDSDKYIIVGTHHDEAGSGNVDPASGQAVMRELIRLIGQNEAIIGSRRSIVFFSTDTAYLDIAAHEFIEENLREHGERAVAYISLKGTLAQGPYLHVKSSPPLQNFIRKVVSDFSNTNASYQSVEGPNAYRTFYSNLGAPIIELSFSNKEQARGVDSLPVCCDPTTASTNEDKVRLTAEIHLQTILKLAGEPILPYDPSEIQVLYNRGFEMVQRNRDLVEDNLYADFQKGINSLNKMQNRLNKTLENAFSGRHDDMTIRRLNDALTGLTRSCILPQGVPMIHPENTSVVIRNLDNRNLLLGSTSRNEYEVRIFPGLYELFTLSKDPRAPEISDEISKHITEIMASMVDFGDYSKRAIFDSNLSSQ